MEVYCCRYCRLIQPPADFCRDCARAAPEPLMAITTPEIGGARSIQRVPPADATDDDVMRMGAIAMAAGVAGAALLHFPFGFLVGPIAGWLAYRKRYWKTELVWQQHLTPVPAPRRPPLATVHTGVAEQHERVADELATPGRSIHPGPGRGEHPFRLGARKPSGPATPHRPPPLVVSTALFAGEELLLRSVEAVPFWLAQDGRRVLVSGAAWVHVATPPPRLDPQRLLSTFGLAKLPVTRATRLVLHGVRAVIRAGDPITVLGELRKEQMIGVAGPGDGYRDAFAEVLHGAPGAPLWIEKQRDLTEG
jgi:hypothetical protein